MRAINRTLEMWEPLCSYFTSHPDVEKAGKVKTIDQLLSDPLTKVWFSFLSNVLPVFVKFNAYFQTSSTATVHRLYGESKRLLKTILSFFIKSEVIRQYTSDLTKIKYAETANQVLSKELFIGDSTTALIVHLDENEGHPVRKFYAGVIKFYESFIQKQLKVFDFKSNVICTLSFLDPPLSQKMPLSTFDIIEDRFPISFDKSATKLEYREFMTDDAIDTSVNDAVKFWHKIFIMQSPMGAPKYEHFGGLALHLLSIPVSNADSERVFSLVRKIKTTYRSSLATETLL